MSGDSDTGTVVSRLEKNLNPILEENSIDDSMMLNAESGLLSSKDRSGEFSAGNLSKSEISKAANEATV